MLLPSAVELDARDVPNALSALGSLAPATHEIERAYTDLHAALARKYTNAFRALAGGKGRYVETFRPEVFKSQSSLVAARELLASVEVLAARASDIAENLRDAERMLSVVTPNSGQLFPRATAGAARNFYIDVSGPFRPLFERYRKTACVRLEGMRTGRTLTPVASWDSPIFPFQVALGYLVAATFALQAVYAALPARRLYEVDGNAGARAAAVKLGGRLEDATGTEVAMSDLLGFVATAGSLELYTGRLWSSLGLAFRVSAARVGPFVELAARLVDAEIDATSDAPRGLQGDRLAAWGEHDGKQARGTKKPVGAEVVKHLPGRGNKGRINFSPTWPVIEAVENIFTVNPGGAQIDKTVIMHAEPGAQLGLLVAASLFRRATPFVVADGVDEPLVEQPRVNAGSLEFGGRHPPHETHRSGAEVDLVVPGEHRDHVFLRVLDRTREHLPKLVTEAGFDVGQIATINEGGEIWVNVKKSIVHRRWLQLLEEGIAAARVGGNVYPFRALRRWPFDYYGVYDPANNELGYDFSPNDDEVVVAVARALCLSLLLSGASRVLFADPWVFIDSFHRLRQAAFDFDEALDDAGQDLPKPWGWPLVRVAVLDLYVHHNHWHAEWKLRDGGSSEQTAVGPKIEAWAPVWKALGVEIDLLRSFLAGIKRRSAPASGHVVDQLDSLLRTRWDDTPAMPDLFNLVYGGSEPDRRALLENTAHVGET